MKQSFRVGLGFYCAGVEKIDFLYNFVQNIMFCLNNDISVNSAIPLLFKTIVI